MVSTELADDRSSIKTNDDDEDTTDDEQEAMIENALSSSIPLASIFSTPKEHIADVRKAAREVGLHTALMRRPGARDDGKVSYDRWGNRENSWWVIMGRNGEAVKHLGRMTQQIDSLRMENELINPHARVQPTATIAPTRPMSSAPVFLQLLIAGILGGAAVLFGATRAF